MNANNIFLMTGSHLLADRRRTLLAGVLFVLFASISAPAQRKPQSAENSGSLELVRHHVIFVIDASGSINRPPRTYDEYRSVIRNELPKILKNSKPNGFGVDIYDPKKDRSSAFAFGLSRQSPLFSPAVADSFMKTIWFQERGRTCDELPFKFDRTQRWTAINSAFYQSIRKTQWEAAKQNALKYAFERTFIVVVSDGESNTSTDSLNEIANIRDAARRESSLGPTVINADYDAAEQYVEELKNLFTLSASNAPNKSVGSFVEGNYKIFVRELRPLNSEPLDALLETTPAEQIELSRRAFGQYAGRFMLTPRHPTPEAGVSYELVDLKYRMPGDSDYQSATSLDQPFIQNINISDDRVDDAEVTLLLSFLRREKVYGQSVEVYKRTIKFTREPRRHVLGVIPIMDWQMNLHPSSMTQTEVQAVDSVLLLVIAFGFGVLAYIILFPTPIAEMELAGGPGDPLEIPFNRSGQQSKQHLILRKLRFRNMAFRKVWGRVLPRPAELPFDVHVRIQSEFPSTIKMSDGRVAVGIDEDMNPEQFLTKQTEGSETAILFSPDALADYVDPSTDRVKCDFTIFAKQSVRRFGILRFERSLEPQTQSFYLRFKPEEPNIQLNMTPCLPANSTGTTGTTPFSITDGLTGSINWPHFRGRKSEPDAKPDFYVRVGNAVTRECSKTGLAKLSAVVYRADRKGETFAMDIDHAYQDVIRVETTALNIPVWMPYEKMPQPSSTNGDDYIVEATVTAAKGQQWGSQTIRYGVRVGPDERTSALSFRVGTSDQIARTALRWRSFGSPHDGAVLLVTAEKPVLWNVGKVKESTVFAKIEFDNVARLGEGEVILKLKPQAYVRVHPRSDLGTEPVYARGERTEIVSVLTTAGNRSLGEELEWSIRNEARQRPIVLNLQFQPDAISRMERRPPYFDYVCDLPFECTVRKNGLPDQSFAFDLEVEFRVERYAGEYALAIDFGTSAVVVAFEQDEQKILARHNDVSYATQNLQHRYQTILKDWAKSNEGELCESLTLEKAMPNMEGNNAFIPSALLMRQNKRIGEADFVMLPVSLMQMSKAWDRTVYYLKGLILNGGEVFDYHTVKGFQPLRWRDGSNGDRVAPRDLIPVDEIIRSAYRNLFHSYIKPLLMDQDKTDYLDRLVVSYPNNFTVSHKHRVRQLLQQTFPEFRTINLLSESNAVALYCARKASAFFREPPRSGEARHLLVYDIGAGTADLTYTKLQWQSEQGATVLREMRVIFKAGIPVAGNRLDACLAMIIDEKIRSLIEPLKEIGITLNYINPIVDPDPVGLDLALYAARMLEVKRMLLQLKLDISDAEKPSYKVRIKSDQNDTQAIAKLFGVTIVDDNLMRKQLAKHNMDFERDQWIEITLKRDEIFDHPQVVRWLSMSEQLIENLAGALKVLGVNPLLDTLILSGRTAQFPPLRKRLTEAIKEHLGLDKSKYYAPKLENNENKEAVALGSLMYTILNDSALKLIDRNVWAKYGVIYDDGTGRKFQEFFSYSTKESSEDEVEDQRDGMTVVFFRRSHVITRAVGPIEIVATFSHDPDAALANFQTYLDSFQVLHKVGAGQLGVARKVKITMANNKNDTITVIIDPDGLPKTITVRGYREDTYQVQMEWPYQPLSAKDTRSARQT